MVFLIKTGSVFSTAESDMPFPSSSKEKSKTFAQKEQGKFLAVLWREYGGIPKAGCCGWAFSAAVAAPLCSAAVAALPVPAAADTLPQAFGRSLGRNFSNSTNNTYIDLHSGGVRSVVMLCYVFFRKFLLAIGLHNSCRISPRAGGTCQKCFTKHHN